MTSKRKPYVREVTPGWWKTNPFYKFYILRESTAVLAVWVSLLLLYSLINPVGFFALLKNPLVIVINIVAFLAALLHTKTWFDLTPKALNLTEEKEALLVKALMGATIAVSVLIIVLALAA